MVGFLVGFDLTKVAFWGGRGNATLLTVVFLKRLKRSGVHWVPGF